MTRSRTCWLRAPRCRRSPTSSSSATSSIDQIDREGRKPDGSAVTLPAQKDLLNAVFATDTGVENDPIDAKDEGVIWYEVLGVVPEQLKPFDQVKDEVAKDWRADEVRTKVAKYAQDLVNSLSGGKTLEDIAKDLNVEVLTSDPLKRDGITVYVLPAAVAQAFTLPEKGYGSAPSGVDEGRIVFQVDKVTPPAAARCARGRAAQAAARAADQRGRDRGIFHRARDSATA